MKSWRVMQYTLPLFLEERNYQKNPTSNTWKPMNLLAIIQMMQYFPTVLVFFEILCTPSENWCFSRITANFFPCCFTNETQMNLSVFKEHWAILFFIHVQGYGRPVF